MKNITIFLVIVIPILSCSSEQNNNVVVDDNFEKINTSPKYIDQLIEFFSKIYKKRSESFYPYEMYVLLKSENKQDLWMKFNSESGKDEFYKIYTDFLKNKIEENRYVEERKNLIELFSLTNKYFKVLNGGGTYFGHQHQRIPGMDESEIHQLYINDYDINKTNLEFKSKKISYLDQFKLAMTKLPEADFKLKKLELLEILSEIEKRITNYYYLKKLADFDRYYI